MSCCPEKLHCLSCRSVQPFTEGLSNSTSFPSKKHKIQMTRNTWVGKCGTCGKTVRQFAKAPAKVDEVGESQVAEPQKVAPLVPPVVAQKVAQPPGL